MTDRVPGAPGQYKAVVTAEELLKMQSGEAFTITMVRDDQPVVEGTPYSKEAVLPDDLASQICPDVEDPTPADALSALHTAIGKVTDKDTVTKAESWNVTLAPNASNTHTCSGTVLAVIVAAKNNSTGYVISAVWTAGTSGMTQSMFDRTSDGGTDEWPTKVTISGKNVTVLRDGAVDTATYYVTALTTS